MLAQGSARTLPGDGSVTFALESGTITAGGARIVVADIETANGIIHIIDRVLPAAPASSAAEAAMMPSRIRSAAAILELAIERGVPRFNAGDQASCAALYELAIMSVVLLGNDAIGERASSALSTALKDGAAHEDAAQRAWTYRRGMDSALQSMAAAMQTRE
jgi:hypothetical protein